MSNMSDIFYVVVLVSRFMSKPLKQHFKVAKRTMRYMNGTLHYDLFFPQDKDNKKLEVIAFLILIGVETRLIGET